MMAKKKQDVYQCERCGQTWPVHPFSLVPCPICHAKVGQRCLRPSDHSGPFVGYHVAREQAAIDAGILQKCPGEPKIEKPSQPELF